MNTTKKECELHHQMLNHAISSTRLPLEHLIPHTMTLIIHRLASSLSKNSNAPPIHQNLAMWSCKLDRSDKKIQVLWYKTQMQASCNIKGNTTNSLYNQCIMHTRTPYPYMTLRAYLFSKCNLPPKLCLFDNIPLKLGK